MIQFLKRQASTVSNASIGKIKLFFDLDNIPKIKDENGNLISLKGEKGDQGIQGIQGIQGEQGIQGIQGVSGVLSFKSILTNNVTLPVSNSDVVILSLTLEAGVYFLSSNLLFTRTATGAGYLNTRLVIDTISGVSISSSTTYHPSVSAGIYFPITNSGIVTLTEQKTILLVANHSAGSSANTIRTQSRDNKDNATLLTALKIG